MTVAEDEREDRNCSAKARAEQLWQICENHKWTQKAPTKTAYLEKIVIDERHKVLFCPITKVASSTFDSLMAASASGKPLKKILSKARGREKHMNFVHKGPYLSKYSVRGLSTFSKSKQQAILRDYFKFLVVRHPFDRLVSAYIDKVEYQRNTSEPFPMFVKHADHIVKALNTTRAKLYKKSRKGKLNVFTANQEEFFYLVANYYNLWFKEKHWQTYHELCQPCAMHYDAVVRLETVDQDLPGILSRLPNPDGDTLPVTNTIRYKPGFQYNDKMSKAFESVDLDTVRGLMEVYKKDFELFGYQWNVEQHDADCGYNSGEERCC